ncbi:MAG TPA: hypothetical protein VGD54_02265 [Steroidobacteraceae bacterium]
MPDRHSPVEPSHLPGHAETNLSAGKSFGQSLSVSLTLLNVANRHLLVDNEAAGMTRPSGIV